MRMWFGVLLAGGLAALGAAESPAGLWDSWDWPGRLQNREEGSMRMWFGVLLVGGLTAPAAAKSPAGLWDSWD